MVQVKNCKYNLIEGLHLFMVNADYCKCQIKLTVLTCYFKEKSNKLKFELPRGPTHIF